MYVQRASTSDKTEILDTFEPLHWDTFIQGKNWSQKIFHLIFVSVISI